MAELAATMSPSAVINKQARRGHHSVSSLQINARIIIKNKTEHTRQIRSEDAQEVDVEDPEDIQVVIFEFVELSLRLRHCRRRKRRRRPLNRGTRSS